MHPYHAQDTSVINLLMKIKGKGDHWQRFFTKLTFYAKVLGEKSDLDVAQEM
jgi:hypothetical protein